MPRPAIATHSAAGTARPRAVGASPFVAALSTLLAGMAWIMTASAADIAQPELPPEARVIVPDPESFRTL